jgi:hypothetical protein
MPRVEPSEGGTTTNTVTMMKRVILDRPKVRRVLPPDPLPIDPRDPDIVRAKARLYAAAAKRPRQAS